MTRIPSSGEPTPIQALLLWALVARGGDAAQKDLKPTPTKAVRDALVHAGLLRAGKLKQAILIELTDRGWAWAAANTGAALPANTTSGTVVLAGLLHRLGAYMTAHDVALADIIRPVSREAMAGPATTDLARRIRTAYLGESGGGVNQGVRLSAIRERLADVSRADLDAALLMLAKSGAAELMPLDDPTEIGAVDRAAAIPVGVEARHLLWLHR
jgi:hypothetical protein